MSKKRLRVRQHLLLIPLLAGFAAFVFACCSARAEDGGGAPDPAGSAVTVPEPRLALKQDWQREELPAAAERPSQHRRYAMLCLANAYPGLKSEELITGLFDPVMGFLAPGIDHINTFSDMRDNHLLWVPNIGGGYNLSRHFSVFVTLGYGAGPVRTEDDQTSIFLLPMHLDFVMKRYAFTITPGLDYFPFGMVEQRDYAGLMDRLRAIRPMIGVRVPWTYAGYTAHAKIGLGPVKKLIDFKLEDSWCLWSTNVNVGFDVPVNRSNQVNVNFGHSHFFGQDSDFGGNVFSVTWKYLF